MKSIFKELQQEEEDYSAVTPISTLPGLTPISPYSAYSPFTLIYLSNLSSFGPFSMLAEIETRKTEELAKVKQKCGCSKTKCLKLYCECFSKGVLCDGCDCKSCHNTEEYKEERDDVITKTKLKNPGAFRVDISSNYKICRCSKSNCQKKYCECYQNGRSCNSNCRCRHCENGSMSV